MSAADDAIEHPVPVLRRHLSSTVGIPVWIVLAGLLLAIVAPAATAGWIAQTSASAQIEDRVLDVVKSESLRDCQSRVATRDDQRDGYLIAQSEVAPGGEAHRVLQRIIDNAPPLRCVEQADGYEPVPALNEEGAP